MYLVKGSCCHWQNYRAYTEADQEGGLGNRIQRPEREVGPVADSGGTLNIRLGKGEGVRGQERAQRIAT